MEQEEAAPSMARTVSADRKLVYPKARGKQGGIARSHPNQCRTLPTLRATMAKPATVTLNPVASRMVGAAAVLPVDLALMHQRRHLTMTCLGPWPLAGDCWSELRLTWKRCGLWFEILIYPTTLLVAFSTFDGQAGPSKGDVEG